MKPTAKEQSNVTPKEDLMNDALKHYEIAGMAIHEHRSDIPKAIRAYYAAAVKSEPAEGAEEILRRKYANDKWEPNFKGIIEAMDECTTANAQRLADKMVEERMRDRELLYDILVEVAKYVKQENMFVPTEYVAVFAEWFRSRMKGESK